jgi:hypothetical protein
MTILCKNAGLKNILPTTELSYIRNSFLVLAYFIYTSTFWYFVLNSVLYYLMRPTELYSAHSAHFMVTMSAAWRLCLHSLSLFAIYIYIYIYIRISDIFMNTKGLSLKICYFKAQCTLEYPNFIGIPASNSIKHTHIDVYTSYEYLYIQSVLANHIFNFYTCNTS